MNPTTDPIDTPEQIIQEFFEHSYMAGVRNEHDDDSPQKFTKEQALAALTSYYHAQTKARETELLDSLYWMYVQYIGDDKWGHKFMGAGETASELLELAGYIEVDNVGMITKDNGDSFARQLKEEV